MLMLRLRQATEVLHSRIEALLAIETRLQDAASYRELLASLYGFYMPVEQSLQPHGTLLEQRLKSPWLMSDLRALGMSDHDISAIPSCAVLPNVTTLPRAIGSLYVLEEATLGCRVSAALVRKSLGIEPGKGDTFFNGYGEHTGAMWKTFSDYAERHCNSPAKHTDALNAALRTFECLDDWLGRNLTTAERPRA